MTYTRDRVADAAANARPYFERALRDEELHRSVRNAYTSGRSLYDRLVSRRNLAGTATRLATDKNVHSDLWTAIEELRNAAARVQGVERKAEERHSARNTVLLIAGIVLGILFNPVTGPPLRRLLAKTLLGDESDYVYGGNGAGRTD